MKKNFVRIVAALLVAMLALTLIPMGALAASVDVYRDFYDERHPTWEDYSNNTNYEYHHTVKGAGSVTIKTSDYDSYIVYKGDEYDLKGFPDWEDYEDNDDLMSYCSSHTSKWDWDIAYLIYVPHKHKLTGWISDGTTHWKNCVVCREKFIHQNWCQDGDEDRICNVCGGNVPYHDVVVIESEGGTITVNKDLASHRTKITADVETNEGYTFKKLHFTKVRNDGSKQEITRYQKDGQFWTRMPTYKLEISAEFTKN